MTSEPAAEPKIPPQFIDSKILLLKDVNNPKDDVKRGEFSSRIFLYERSPRSSYTDEMRILTQIVSCKVTNPKSVNSNSLQNAAKILRVLTRYGLDEADLAVSYTHLTLPTKRIV